MTTSERTGGDPARSEKHSIADGHPGPEESGDPLVTMIIPVYNSINYLPETLDSLLNQGLDSTQLEVLTIDDCSTDGSGEMLDDYAERYENFRVIHHEVNSGGAGAPCNTGIDAARGKYFFVLGSDDLMTPNALRDLAAVAEREGSDVVLAKMAGLNGRHAPGSMFKRSRMNATLMEDNLFYTLTLIKLFRTDLVREIGARSPTKLKVGSDQPFTAKVYFHAKKVSVCADRDYVLIRARDDGSNVTRVGQPMIKHAEMVEVLLSVILEDTEPGELRDHVMRRPLRGKVEHLFVSTKLLKQPEEDQREILAMLQRMLPQLWNPRSARHVDPLTRTKIDLVVDGRLDTLRRVLEWERSSGGITVRFDGERFVPAMPPELAEEVGAERLYEGSARGRVRLEGLQVDGESVVLESTAVAVGSASPAPEAALRLTSRYSSWTEEIPAEIGEPGDEADGASVRITAACDTSRLPLGVWDVFVVQHFGDREIVKRLGADRAERVADRPLPIPASSEDSAGEQPREGLVYFTKNYGNVSIDLGFVVKSRESIDGADDEERTSVLGLLDGVRLPDPTPLDVVPSVTSGTDGTASDAKDPRPASDEGGLSSLLRRVGRRLRSGPGE